MQYVISDNHSGHGLPVGAGVEPCDPPNGFESYYSDVQWYTQGGDGDERAIDPRDLSDTRPDRKD